jgi:hypothetical protein
MTHTPSESQTSACESYSNILKIDLNSIFETIWNHQLENSEYDLTQIQMNWDYVELDDPKFYQMKQSNTYLYHCMTQFYHIFYVNVNGFYN